MQRRDVTSSNIKSIGYDFDNSTLEIAFHSGATWEYYDFSESSWYEFDGAESHGKYFNTNIKGQFREARIG
jgi:hypothetical protein